MYVKSAAFYDAIYAHLDYQGAADLLHRLIQQHQRAPDLTLLDVACGTGRHLQHLAPRYEVEGLDLSPEMLEIARRRLPGVAFLQGDMLDFDLGRQFGAIICLFSAIGYVRTVDRLHRALATFARHTRPGGVVVIEAWLTPDAWIDGKLNTLYVDQPELKIARMAVSEREGTLSIMDMHHLVATPAGVEHFVEHHELGLFTPDEYRAAFTAAGLTVAHEEPGLLGRGLYLGVRPV